MSDSLPLSQSGTPLTERELQLTILAVMDALDANVGFGEADPAEFERIIKKLQRKTEARTALGQEWVSRVTGADAPDQTDPPNQGCTRVREGWYCSRKPGHDGPCAARAVVSEGGRDFATQMSEKSWKAWLDAHPEKPPASSPPDIAEAIEYLVGCIPTPSNPVAWGIDPEKIAAARSALESLFRQQLEEIQELKSLIQGYALALRSSETDKTGDTES